jgi:mRNA interferase MazF
MPSTTSLHRGDVVLVQFVFADEKGVKRRPGLILSSDAYHRGRREAALAAITSNTGRSLYGDYRIEDADLDACGLPLPSIVTGILRTIKQDMIALRLGRLPEAALEAVAARVRASLAL